MHSQKNGIENYVQIMNMKTLEKIRLSFYKLELEKMGVLEIIPFKENEEK